MAASWKTEPGLGCWDGGGSRGFSRLAGEEEGERDRQADSGDSECSHSDSFYNSWGTNSPSPVLFQESQVFSGQVLVRSRQRFYVTWWPPATAAQGVAGWLWVEAARWFPCERSSSSCSPWDVKGLLSVKMTGFCVCSQPSQMLPRDRVEVE